MQQTMQRSTRDLGRRLLATGALAAIATTAQASVVMSATRYVYPSSAKEITSKISNVGKLPALTQVWIDDGDEKSTPENVDVPFNLTPPIARIEAGKSQTVRIAHTGGVLPGDRESQFWLNVLEVPPKADDVADENKVQLAFRYRLKMFYRPRGLPGSADSAAESLSWSRDGSSLKVANDSAFYVTVNDLTLVAGGKLWVMEPFAIAPRATSVLPAKAPLPAGATMVHFKTINDYGGFVPHSKPLSP
jgi:P pilus assembly chaperone PapD